VPREMCLSVTEISASFVQILLMLVLKDLRMDLVKRGSILNSVEREKCFFHFRGRV
jgi:hypothetical protein